MQNSGYVECDRLAWLSSYLQSFCSAILFDQLSRHCSETEPVIATPYRLWRKRCDECYHGIVKEAISPEEITGRIVASLSYGVGYGLHKLLYGRGIALVVASEVSRKVLRDVVASDIGEGSLVGKAFVVPYMVTSLVVGFLRRGGQPPENL